MSDTMQPIPFGAFMTWILNENAKYHTIFGIHTYFHASDKTLPLFSEVMEVPVGPAAGPHTQLAQNIVASYVAGSRFFELKTVQTLDGEDLPVSKPCINALDECYNVEWSTELRVAQALDEYIKGWFALKLLSRELGLGGENGFIFNMSVGYDYAGITSDYIDRFIEGLKDATHTQVWKECQDWTLQNLHRFARVDKPYINGISPHICTSITLSTLHGCPAQDIERIASYLIKTKKLNTFVKCNPTLLGYEFARNTLDALGYDAMCFDDFHFKDDLQYCDALPMFARLLALAQQDGLSFGVKLTNTFPVKIAANELPGEEMYLSGKALYPLTIELAKRISADFDGKLKISFSGGADARNVKGLFEAGIFPITLASTLLKPGGYQRLTQIAQILQDCDYTQTKTDVCAVAALAAQAPNDSQYKKAIKPLPSRKTQAKVPLTDCFFAPCEQGCPIHQDIPAYIRLMGEGKPLDALKVITEKNPLPFITGTLCTHRCMDRCTRNFYESPVRIRDVKLQAATQAHDALMAQCAAQPAASPRTDCKVAIVGGGVAGLATAYLLSARGVCCCVFEKEPQLGGVVRNIIPAFRIQPQAIDRDVAFIQQSVQRMGGKLLANTVAPDFAQLRALGYTHIVLATGAHKPIEFALDGKKPITAMEFLSGFSREKGTVPIGKHVVVIGGGNTAMDTARAAKRTADVETVSVVYRRTKRYMPADEEELQFALEEGVLFCELTAPLKHENGVLTCAKMVLGEPDESGRRSPVQTQDVLELAADTVILAIGEQVDAAQYRALGIALDDKNRPILDESLRTNLPDVYLVGDACKGPATVVVAIADATKVADCITGAQNRNSPAQGNACKARAKKGNICLPQANVCEMRRCLECSTVCETCVDVCPNRANVAIPQNAKTQILHIDALCNECGNCMTFCPYDSAPYQEKLTLFADQQAMKNSANDGFYPIDANRFALRLSGCHSIVLLNAANDCDPALTEFIRSVQVWQSAINE